MMWSDQDNHHKTCITTRLRVSFREERIEEDERAIFAHRHSHFVFTR